VTPLPADGNSQAAFEFIRFGADEYGVKPRGKVKKSRVAKREVSYREPPSSKAEQRQIEREGFYASPIAVIRSRRRSPAQTGRRHPRQDLATVDDSLEPFDAAAAGALATLGEPAYYRRCRW
jgi:hypothetical protein